jgi:hypothetical protein
MQDRMIYASRPLQHAAAFMLPDRPLKSAMKGLHRVGAGNVRATCPCYSAFATD